MPFDSTYRNPRLIQEFLTVDYEGATAPLALNLNTCLGSANGKFQWGGRDIMKTLSARKFSLSGSDLSAELQHNGRWHNARIDLSTNIRIRNGGLEYFDGRRDLPADPPPAYPKDGFKSFRSFKSKSSSYSERSSSYFMYTVPVDKLRLEGSFLHAQCLRTDGTFASSQLDLNDYIGVVNGRLVWGRKNFRSSCESVKLEGYNLVAQCRDDLKALVSSTLELSRYLQSYDGILGVKVLTESSSELSDLFSEARWMKVRVVTEPDASAVLQSSAFRAAFGSLAETTTKHVVAEMTQELAESASQDIKASMADKVKAEMSRIVSDAMGAQIREQITQKIEVAFATAKEAVLKACDEMVDEALNKVTVQCTESIIGPMGDEVVAQCNNLIADAMTEVTASAIGHFQERVEILMEREIVSASLRSAHSVASYMKLVEAMSGSY